MYYHITRHLLKGHLTSFFKYLKDHHHVHIFNTNYSKHLVSR